MHAACRERQKRRAISPERKARLGMGPSASRRRPPPQSQSEGGGRVKVRMLEVALPDDHA
jgi:hypothetical protein